MKKIITVMKDDKVGFMTPTVDINKETAIRNFKYCINQQEYYHANAADFSLFIIGEYDDQIGSIETRVPEFVCNGTAVMLKEGE